jgi:hypothetical protein
MMPAPAVSRIASAALIASAACRTSFLTVMEMFDLLQRFRSRSGLPTSTANWTVGPYFREITGLWLSPRRRRSRVLVLK